MGDWEVFANALLDAEAVQAWLLQQEWLWGQDAIAIQVPLLFAGTAIGGQRQILIKIPITKRKLAFSLHLFLANEELRACIFSLGNAELNYFSQLMHSFLDLKQATLCTLCPPAKYLKP